MKILQLIPQFVFPATDGGKIGIANIFTEFSKLNEVTLFALSNKKIEEKYLEDAAKYGYVILQYANTKNSFSNISKTFLTKEPLYLFKHISKPILRKIDSLISEKKIDIVHADHTAMAPIASYIKYKYGIPCGLRLHNIEHRIWERYAEELKFGSLKQRFVSRQANLLKEREIELISEMDVNFAITDVDKKRALKLSPNAKVEVATAGVNPKDWYQGKRSQKYSNKLVIASTWAWVHNVDALRWFVEEVLPLVKSKVNDVELNVLGKNPPNWLYKARSVEILGFVDDILQTFQSSNVYVAPLFVGSGIRIKILEAMGSGLPVVATSVSAEGIYAGAEQGLFVADDAEAQASIIVSLLKNKSKAYELGQKASEYVYKNHTWEQSVNIMLQEYKKFTGK